MRVKPIPYLCLAVFLVIGCEQDAPTAAIEDADLAAPMTVDAPASQVAASKGGMSGNGGPFEFNPAGDTENNSYIVFGVDWNVLLGVSEQLLVFNSADHPSNQVRPGEFTLARTPGWLTTPEYSDEVREALDAAGYVFRGATPAEDFVAKVDHVYVIIDPGKPQERTLVWDGDSAVRYWPLSDYGLGNGDNIYINGWAMVPPKKPGVHTVVVGYTLSEWHYDGFPTNDPDCPDYPLPVLCSWSILDPGNHDTERHFTVVSK